MGNKAREFALKAHGDQKYGTFPYSVHLDEVASIAKSYGKTAEAVAFLHDVIEDTDITAKEIEQEFGCFISRCVQILSDEPGDTRTIRKAATYKKMGNVKGDESLALLVKAADRLANMRACIREGNEKYLTIYKSEYDVFRKSAYRFDLCEEIWAELESIQHA
ncbi:HD domain-containing protein [Marinicellulosiphila megalodicopiae]|uniref:HD domain-containing protein n=1 Tax=Marinicellulosiphila megalodicopiae TaxID=2724896 RepID=UPI003BAEDD16